MLAAETRLGPYQIVAPLGAGGMGEVYRARDTRLGRDVAIKVLAQQLTSSPDVRARFEREAQAVSALNHPNICTLYDVGRDGDRDFLVMELMVGELLADRLARGPLPLAEALKCGVQIADALDRAHRAGVVHRDLKPGNVMLTRSGAKLMDFGLARVTAPTGPLGPIASSSGKGSTVAVSPHSPVAAQPLTAEGTIVGTIQYMAPEQLEGREADARSDLWSLGCVLFEMTTGRRAFAGATQASLIGAIMRDQPPPISSLAPVSPPALERLVRQCLEKDPEERWQSAGDIRRELQWILDTLSGAEIVAGGGIGGGGRAASLPGARVPLPAARTGSLLAVAGRARIAWLAAGVALLALAAALLVLLPARRAPQPRALVRFVVPQPEGTTLKLPSEMVVSPDGSAVAFVVVDSTGVFRLCLRPLRTTEVRTLPGTANASLPFWSPDGRWIAFFANGKLLKVGLDGSAPVSLCDAPDGRGGAWAPGGTILFAPNNSGPIYRVADSGGDPTPVTRIDAARHEFGHRYPRLLPDGRHFLYISIRPSDRHTVCVGSLDGGQPKELFASYSEAVFARGYLLTNEQGRVMARRFDPGALAVRGDPLLVIEGAEQENIGYDNLAVDDRGTLVYQHHAAITGRLEWRSRGGALLSAPAAGVPTDAQFGVSPDARRVVYATREPRDLWTLDLDGSLPARLTFENSNVNTLAISADGRRVAFARQLGFGAYDLRVKPLDGSGPETSLFHGPGLFTLPQTWSPDGQWVVASVSDSTGSFDFWLVPADGTGRARPYERTPAREEGAAISPDGRWMAYCATERGNVAVYVAAFPAPSTKYQISLPDPVLPIVYWSRDGRELLLGDLRDRVIAVDVQTAPTFRQGASHVLFTLPTGAQPIGAAPDDSRILIAVTDPATSRAGLEVVLDWPQLIPGQR